MGLGLVDIACHSPERSPRMLVVTDGLWSKEAEDYLLAHAPKLEIGEPKDRIVERSLPC